MSKSDDLFGDNAIKRYLDKLEDVPDEGAEVGVVVEGTDVGIKGSVSKDLGKAGGWDVAAEGSWMRRQGAKLAAMLRWRGKT